MAALRQMGRKPAILTLAIGAANSKANSRVRVKPKDKPKRDAEYINRAKKSDADASELKNKTHGWNRDEIEGYLRSNPPSPETIAALLHGLDAEKSRKGGIEAAKTTKAETETRDKNIAAQFNEMTHVAMRDRAALLAKKHDISPDRVRTILKKMGVR